MKVHYCRRARPSALALQARLTQSGYNGRSINFGCGIAPDALNSPQAIQNATNKRLMRQLFAQHDVPAPKLLTMNEALDAEFHDWYGNQQDMVVGRPDSHRQGRGFWLCHDPVEVSRAMDGTRRKAAATHFMEYIPIEREFRVHVMNGKSIKISEKIGGGNHRRGATFKYPHDFGHKITLRKAAIAAVEALGLDFGAVDVGWYDGKPYVFEVNSAPCLTDTNSDTLAVYVTAFNREYGDTGGDNDHMAVRDGTVSELMADLPTRFGGMRHYGA